jgi:hypothetical protein
MYMRVLTILYLCKLLHQRIKLSRNQRTDVGKYSFVNRTILNWNQLRAERLGTFPCKPKIFLERELGKQL